MSAVGGGPAWIRLDADASIEHDLASLFFWQVIDDAPSRWHVRARLDPWTGPHRRRTPVSFEFDEAAWELETNPLTVEMARTGGVVQVDEEEGSVTIWNGDRRALTVDTYRVLRQLLLADMQGRGLGCLHASAVARGGKAVALVGRKGAGKSTMATFLAARGWELLSNDKLMIGPHHPAQHVPEAPAITVQTLLALPDLARRWNDLLTADVVASEVFLDHPAPPAFAALAGLPPVQKVFFSERELAHLLGTKGVVEASLEAVVVLDSGDAPAGWRATRPVALDAHQDGLEMFPDWMRVRPPMPKVRVPDRTRFYELGRTAVLTERAEMLTDLVSSVV